MLLHQVLVRGLGGWNVVKYLRGLVRRLEGVLGMHILVFRDDGGNGRNGDGKGYGVGGEKKLWQDLMRREMRWEGLADRVLMVDLSVVVSTRTLSDVVRGWLVKVKLLVFRYPGQNEHVNLGWENRRHVVFHLFRQRMRILLVECGCGR